LRPWFFFKQKQYAFLKLKIVTATISIIVLVFSVLSCNGEKHKNLNIEVIDFTKVSSAPLSEVHKAGILGEPVYIPLNNTIDGMWLRNISTVRMYDNKFYVADKYLRSNLLIVYNAEGMPVSSVGSQGRGPGEYLQITDFDIDNSGNIHLIDGQADNLIIFNTKYEFSETKKLPYEVDMIKCLDNGNYLVALSPWNIGKYRDDMIAIADKDLNIIESVIKYDRALIDENFYLGEFQFTTSSDKIFFRRPIIDSVYVMNRAGALDMIYYFDFGSSQMPHKYRANIEPFWENKEINSYRTLIDFSIANDRYALGWLFDKGVRKYYIMERDKGVAYEKTAGALEEDIFGEFITVQDTNLVTVIAVTEGIINMLPENIRERARQSDYILCLYPLK